jgi:putative transcriptional regulator
MIVKERVDSVASSLAPSFLLSMPQLIDPNFKQTVVLLCRHNEDGAFGLVVNRPLTTSGRVVINLDPPVTTDRELQLWVGGPVEPERSWILVGRSVAGKKADYTEGIRVTDDLMLSTSPDLLRRLLDPTPPANARLIVGYSGWRPGQLEAELEASAWLMSDVDRNLIFNTPADRMWETAIRRLGADPSALQMSRGVH